MKQILWRKNDLGLYSQSANCFIQWILENETKPLEIKPIFRFDGGFTTDREEKFVYLASDDGCIRTLYNGQVRIPPSHSLSRHVSTLSVHQRCEITPRRSSQLFRNLSQQRCVALRDSSRLDLRDQDSPLERGVRIHLSLSRPFSESDAGRLEEAFWTKHFFCSLRRSSSLFMKRWFSVAARTGC